MTDICIMNPKKQVGKNLKDIRRSLKLSREKLATRSGISAAAIINIENGARFPRPENLEALSKALGVSWETLMTHHLDPNKLKPASVMTDEQIVRIVAAKFGIKVLSKARL